MAAKHPVTMAVRALRAAKVDFEPHLYPWEPHGGTGGLLVAIDPRDAQRVLSPTLVDVATE